MITVDSVLGNINNDKKLKEKYDEMTARKVCETIKISRLESQRVRMRKISDKGTDVALTLPPGTRLKHGDVIIITENKMVVVVIESEDVIMIEIRDNIHQDDIVEVPVRVGHTIGNLHRPIRLEGNKIYFPIQADTELEMFKKLFEPINEHLDIKKTTMVFEPEDGTEIHEHS
ncbi:MAG: Urease accessory protein [Candidatus Nitrosopolaris wilkensis]|nr:MAG: Urease accessory protein [Candidatus Nitrosopolaris wilkensis]